MKKIKCLGCKKMKEEKEYRVGKGIRNLYCRSCKNVSNRNLNNNKTNK